MRKVLEINELTSAGMFSRTIIAPTTLPQAALSAEKNDATKMLHAELMRTKAELIAKMAETAETDDAQIFSTASRRLAQAASTATSTNTGRPSFASTAKVSTFTSLRASTSTPATSPTPTLAG